jgi:hypothetical protein
MVYENGGHEGIDKVVLNTSVTPQGLTISLRILMNMFKQLVTEHSTCTHSGRYLNELTGPCTQFNSNIC